MPPIAKLFRRTGRERLLFLEALLALVWARLLVRFVPFQYLAPRLGQRDVSSSATLTPADRAQAIRVSWAVQAAARNIPLGFVCLPQAIAAKWMLRHRRIPSTLYLGIPRKGGQAAMVPHAWLRAGEKIVTGEGPAAEHVAILTLGE